VLEERESDKGMDSNINFIPRSLRGALKNYK
jgi:hypothetical protein